MMRGAWVVGEAGWAAGLAAAAAEALLGAGCRFNSLARSAAPGRSCAQAGLETGADASARQSPAEVARNNLLLRRKIRIPVSANSSLGRGRRGPVFRKDSAGPGHSRSSGASAPAPKPAQAEIQRPGPAHQADAPKQLRMHSTEDAPRRGAESEKDWPTRCLQKV